MPHGSVVGVPYSSWLKKLPQRAMACITNRPGRDDVGPAQERDLLVARVQARGDRARDDPAVDAEAGVRRQEDLDRVVLVQRPLVDDVVGAAADERRDRDDDDPVAEDLGVLAGSSGQPDHDQVGGRETEGVADPVPVDGERAERKAIGSGVKSSIRGSVAAALPILRGG